MYVHEGFDDAKKKNNTSFIYSPNQDQENKDQEES